MPLWILALPALVATQAPSPLPAVDQLQDRLEAIPEAFIAGRRGSMRTLVGKAKVAWGLAKPELRKTMPEPDATFIDKQLKAMQTMKPREQAMGALGISSTLSRFQARSRQQELLQADRAVMATWCGVDAGQWEPLPNLVEAFKPLLDKDNGQHTLVVIGVQDALKRFQESRQKRHTVSAKKALHELLAFVDAFEKP